MVEPMAIIGLVEPTSSAQKTSTVARVKLFYVACSKNGFLSLDIDTE
jgi:hypothetical protein